MKKTKEMLQGTDKKNNFHIKPYEDWEVMEVTEKAYKRIIELCGDCNMNTEQIKDTQNIQLVSLDSFMSVLGYKRENKRYDNGKEDCGQRYVSFRTATMLHNSKWEYDVSSYVFYPVNKLVSNTFCATTEQYYKSQARKLVEKVKLQPNKRGEIQTQSQVVEFTTEWYYDLLLGDN